MKMMKNAVEEKAYENQEAYQRTQMQKDMIFERLREQGCRITRQRQLILDIILEEECSCCKENGCTVRLSDDTVCKLPSEVWKQVVRAGLKNMGYIGDQDIESIEMTMSKCRA